MSDRNTEELPQGLWIDQRRLAEAGLEGPLEIRVQPGEIRIRSAGSSLESDGSSSPQSRETSRSSDAWELFRSLGSEAQPGRVADPSLHHDRYLYGGSE